jgi:hypothetical protein
LTTEELLSAVPVEVRKDYEESKAEYERGFNPTRYTNPQGAKETAAMLGVLLISAQNAQLLTFRETAQLVNDVLAGVGAARRLADAYTSNPPSSQVN